MKIHSVFLGVLQTDKHRQTGKRIHGMISTGDLQGWKCA